MVKDCLPQKDWKNMGREEDIGDRVWWKLTVEVEVEMVRRWDVKLYENRSWRLGMWKQEGV